jgi:hypothetical protein
MTNLIDICTAALAEQAVLQARVKHLEEEVKEIDECFSSWFDRKKLTIDATTAPIVNAAEGYLRTCRSGGMETDNSDMVIAVIENMALHGVFADQYIRVDCDRDITQIATARNDVLDEVISMFFKHPEYDCDSFSEMRIFLSAMKTTEPTKGSDE